MKRQVVQPPLMQLVERHQVDQETEVMDLLVCLECLGLPAQRHHAQALYDMGMRGLGLYPRKDTSKAELFAAADGIVKLKRLVELHDPNKRKDNQK